MKTYPYMEGDQLIQLVDVREYDELAELALKLANLRAEDMATIKEMREAIREAHKIIQVLYMDALDHHKESWPRANEWMEKHAAIAEL